MAAQYDQVTNSPMTSIMYNQNGINNNYYPNYPDSNSITVFGPTYVPRIYGLNLTALEIASSGTIDITLNDTYSLNISRSNYINLNNFQTSFVSQSNYSMNFVASCNSIQLDVLNANVNIVAPSNVNITSSNMNFYVTNSHPGIPVFQVSSNAISINGNLIITGNITTCNIVSTNVYQETLNIADNQIHLSAVGSNDAVTGLPHDGLTTNNLSGIVIEGTPQGTPSNLWTAYQKSFLWNYGNGSNGVLDIGTSNTSTESFWEVNGGSFRLTAPSISSNINTPVSFIFRINDLSELEIVKLFSISPGSNTYQRIARFGRVF